MGCLSVTRILGLLWWCLPFTWMLCFAFTGVSCLISQGCRLLTRASCLPLTKEIYLPWTKVRNIPLSVRCLSSSMLGCFPLASARCLPLTSDTWRCCLDEVQEWTGETYQRSLTRNYTAVKSNVTLNKCRGSEEQCKAAKCNVEQWSALKSSVEQCRVV